jgi:hypothetical protein
VIWNELGDEGALTVAALTHKMLKETLQTTPTILSI